MVRLARPGPRPGTRSVQMGISSASNIASKSVARSAAIRRTITVASERWPRLLISAFMRVRGVEKLQVFEKIFLSARRREFLIAQPPGFLAIANEARGIT